MKRKIILATVLCLAVVALGIGAAPALAANGCDCHTAVPPSAAPAHAPYVAGVTDCTTCHVGWVVPHAAFLKPLPGFKPFMTIKSDGSVACVVGGRLAKPNRARTGINGIVVYLQERAVGASEFTDIGQSTTHGVLLGPNGQYGLPVDSTAKGTVYRAVAQGAARSTIVVPVSATARMQPALELWRMRGLNDVGHIRLGRSVVALGRAAPGWFVGEKVKLTLKKGPDGHQRVVRRVERRIKDGGTLGTFRWKITFHKRGEYALYARWSRTADHPAVSAIEWWFTVK